MLTFRSALDVAQAIRSKEVSPVEVVRHYLEVCDQKNGQLNAVIWRRDEAALSDARRAEKAVLKGEELPPFCGVPYLVKDLTEAYAEPVTQGSRCAQGYQGQYDSSVVSLFKKAGFISLGRSNSPELGALPVTENALFGATRNPWNRERTPGGSSGGAAAAVASGMSPMAHASDGGGSIRIPASCCGLVGLKPSRGRVPKGPYASDVMHGFAVDGCVTTTVADTAAMMDILCQYDPTAWYSAPPPDQPYRKIVAKKAPRLRVGFTIHGPIPTSVDTGAVEAVTKTATLLAEMGHQVSEVNVPWRISPDQLLKDFVAVWCTGTAYFDAKDWSKLEPINAGLRQLGLAQTSLDYVKAVMNMQSFSRRILSLWGETFDILLTPTLAIEPPPIGWIFENGEQDPYALLMRACEMVPYTSWINITGQPAISLPTSMASSGLPMGVQLTAALHREDLLLQLGQELEEALQWQALLPPA